VVRCTAQSIPRLLWKSETEHNTAQFVLVRLCVDPSEVANVNALVAVGDRIDYLRGRPVDVQFQPSQFDDAVMENCP
jgi:hypothetical protein